MSRGQRAHSRSQHGIIPHRTSAPTGAPTGHRYPTAHIGPHQDMPAAAPGGDRKRFKQSQRGEQRGV